ncbi:hypothetical protein PV08_01714 [Exophiala spinifera]|uniref:Uncharacterized protein n=1 Tax=Exophiala spinifera TaxID=91928 RepID=A0A0D2CCB9_9EURO|nr:uncharacterized protein PV08_01714 [Exophiala spinifera]KIW21134.1 hypothetical protein PV08_01714 [Exophiala spinifera]
MATRIVSVTVQGALLAAASNAIAQGFTIYRERSLSAFDPSPFFQFVVFSILNTPPNYMWQLWLEENFPGTAKKEEKPASALDEKKKAKSDGAKLDEKDTESLSITNTIIKFVLDQSVGAVYNTAAFIVIIGLLRGATYTQTVDALKRDFWPMMIAGYKFWPLVSLLNLAVVPVEQRMLVGGLAGLAWGVYVSLMAI